jgi:hypothetical protein
MTSAPVDPRAVLLVTAGRYRTSRRLVAILVTVEQECVGVPAELCRRVVERESQHTHVVHVIALRQWGICTTFVQVPEISGVGQAGGRDIY